MEAVYTNTNKPGRSRYTLTEVNRGSNGLSREIWRTRAPINPARFRHRRPRLSPQPCSDPDPLDLIEGDGLAAPVVEPGGLGVGVPGHLLRLLELRIGVLEIGGDAGAAEGVVAHHRLDAGGARAPPHRRARVKREHLPDHQPVEEPAKGGELLLDGRGCEELEKAPLRFLPGAENKRGQGNPPARRTPPARALALGL